MIEMEVTSRSRSSGEAAGSRCIISIKTWKFSEIGALPAANASRDTPCVVRLAEQRWSNLTQRSHLLPGQMRSIGWHYSKKKLSTRYRNQNSRNHTAWRSRRQSWHLKRFSGPWGIFDENWTQTPGWIILRGTECFRMGSDRPTP